LAPSVPSIGPASSDKVEHFIGFALLAGPLSFAYPRHIWSVIVAAVIFGAAIEVVQPYVSRGREAADLVADALGALAGGIAARAWARRRACIR
jgi:VanZ family protein